MQQAEILSSGNATDLKKKLNKFFEERHVKKDYIKGVWFSTCNVDSVLMYSVMISYAENTSQNKTEAKNK